MEIFGKHYLWEIAFLIMSTQLFLVHSDLAANDCDEQVRNLVFGGMDQVQNKTSILSVRKNHSVFLQQISCYAHKISGLMLQFPTPADLDLFLENLENSRFSLSERVSSPLDVFISIGSWSTNYGYPERNFFDFGTRLQNISSRYDRVLNVKGISVKMPLPICWTRLADDRTCSECEILSGFKKFKELVEEKQTKNHLIFGMEFNKPFSSNEDCYIKTNTFAFHAVKHADFFIVHVSPPPQTLTYNTFSNSLQAFSANILTKLRLLTLDKEVILSVDMDEKDIEEIDKNGGQLSIYNSVFAKFAFKFGANSKIRVAYPIVESITEVIDLNYTRMNSTVKFEKDLLELGLSYGRLHTLWTLIASQFSTILVDSPKKIDDDETAILSSENNYSNDGGLNTTTKMSYSLEIFFNKLNKFNGERKKDNLSTLSVVIQQNYNGDENRQLFQQVLLQLESAQFKYGGIIEGIVLFLTEYICFEYELRPTSVAEVDEIKLLLQSSKNISLLSVACQHNSDSRYNFLPRLSENGYQLVRKMQEGVGTSSISYFQHSFQCNSDFNKTVAFVKDLLGKRKVYKFDQLWFQVTCHRNDVNLSCANFNQFYEFLGNWAEIYRVRLVITPAFDTLRGASHGWFGTYSGEVAQTQGLVGSDFFVKREEPCVVMTTGAIQERIPLNNSAFTGICINLTSETLSISNASFSELGVLVQMISLRFKTMEIACDDGKLKKVQEVMQILDDIESHEKSSAKARIYLNLPRNHGENHTYIFDKEIDTINNLRSKDRTRLVGVHLSGNTSDCLKQAKSFKSQLSGKVLIGCEFSFEEGFPRTGELLGNLDYAMLDVNILEFLETEGYTLKKGSESSPVNNFNEMVTTRWLAPFYSTFHRIRKFRHEAKKLHPNLEILLRFRWAIFEPPSTSGQSRLEVGNMLRVWKFVNEYCTTFNLKYFIYEAVDSAPGSVRIVQESNTRYGWWRVLNYSKLSDASVYVERESEYLRLETPKPLNVLILNPPQTGKPEAASTTSSILLPIVGFVTVSFVLAVLAIVFLAIRLRKRNEILSREEVQLFLYGLENKGNGQEMNDEEKLMFGNAYNGELEIKRDDFIQESSPILGTGNFGAVYKASIARLGGTVAVKVPHPSSAVSDSAALHSNFKMLLSEIKIMSCVREHENVLQILGAYTKEIRRGVVYIVTEYCENGSLQGYLRRLSKELGDGGSADLYQLYEFSQHIAQGMDYIGSKNIMHGDLSTRNVLLSGDYVCKISDFGLSRKMENYGKYMKEGREPLPWRWMAVESLKHMEFTVKSDIWSYGVTLWEIFSLGDHPYPEVTWNEDFVARLTNGMRMSCPRFANDKVYELMKGCWDFNPSARPSFKEIIPYFQAWRSADYTQLF